MRMGQPVAFRLDGESTACTGTTDAAGIATCQSSLSSSAPLARARDTSATFAGSANSLGSSSTKPVERH
jgi:hypothetical protein